MDNCSHVFFLPSPDRSQPAGHRKASVQSVLAEEFHVRNAQELHSGADPPNHLTGGLPRMLEPCLAEVGLFLPFLFMPFAPVPFCRLLALEPALEIVRGWCAGSLVESPNLRFEHTLPWNLTFGTGSLEKENGLPRGSCQVPC